MTRLAVILCLICTACAFVLVLRPNAWDHANTKAQTDAELFAGLIAQPDRIGWRLTEDLTLKRAMLWDAVSTLRYPVPDGFTPVLYEFSEDETRTLTKRQSENTGHFWEQFDTAGEQLLYCSATPSACLIYDRSALAKFLGLRGNALRRASHDHLWSALLLGLAAFFGSAAYWLLHRERQTSQQFVLLPERHTAMRGGLEVLLNARDLKILLLLEQRDGAVVTKDDLYDAGWGRDFMPNSRALDQHMINLRRKLDPDKTRPNLIETVHGVGYRLLR
ncbi:MAG: winged helix-turn-helix domain-containing protein [Sulfitobacter sp.]